MTYEESVKAMREKKERNKNNECYQCANKRNVPGDAHIQCMEPDEKMTGNPLGIKRGWFMHPLVFDPAWKLKSCDNFKEKVE